jgi:hypothetical protein
MDHAQNILRLISAKRADNVEPFTLAQNLENLAALESYLAII